MAPAAPAAGAAPPLLLSAAAAWPSSPDSWRSSCRMDLAAALPRNISIFLSISMRCLICETRERAKSWRDWAASTASCEMALRALAARSRASSLSTTRTETGRSLAAVSGSCALVSASASRLAARGSLPVGAAGGRTLSVAKGCMGDSGKAGHVASGTGRAAAARDGEVTRHVRQSGTHSLTGGRRESVREHAVAMRRWYLLPHVRP
ncbi:Uncharacterised protein [Achromobacter sp. 2789STDY5608633]|nr:Uncharacterised protein [Achromobacter sp. 2789STDY5608633]